MLHEQEMCSLPSVICQSLGRSVMLHGQDVCCLPTEPDSRALASAWHFQLVLNFMGAAGT